MKYFYILLLFSTNLIAQSSVKNQYYYTLGKPYENFNSITRHYYQSGDELLSVKFNKSHLAIQKFNTKNLTHVSTKTYKRFLKNFVFEGLIEARGKYYFFYSRWHEGSVAYAGELYVREIDFKLGEFIGKQIKLATFNRKLKSMGGLKYNNSGSNRDSFSFLYADSNQRNFAIYKSKDGDKISISYTFHPLVVSDRKNFDEIGIHIYDSNMNKEWSREYKMPYVEREMDVLAYTISSKNDAYLLIRKFHDKSNKDLKKGKSNYHLELFKFSKDTEEIMLNEFELGDHYLSDVAIFEDEKGLKCIGFYNNSKSNVDSWINRNDSKDKTGNAKGIFAFIIDENLQIIEDKKHKIPIEVIGKYLGKGGKKRMVAKDKLGKAEFIDLRLKDIIFNDNGSIILLGEQLYSIQNGVWMGMGNTMSYYSGNGGDGGYLKDMFIAKIDVSGDVLYMDRLAKRQKGEFMDKSFTYLRMKDKHYIVFLDHIKNLELTPDNVPERHDYGGGKRGYLMIYEIDDKTGEIKKDAIFDLRKITDLVSGHLFDINRIVRVSDEEFVLELYKKEQEDILIKVKRN